MSCNYTRNNIITGTVTCIDNIRIRIHFNIKACICIIYCKGFGFCILLAGIKVNGYSVCCILNLIITEIYFLDVLNPGILVRCCRIRRYQIYNCRTLFGELLSQILHQIIQACNCNTFRIRLIHKPVSCLRARIGIKAYHCDSFAHGCLKGCVRTVRIQCRESNGIRT